MLVQLVQQQFGQCVVAEHQLSRSQSSAVENSQNSCAVPVGLVATILVGRNLTVPSHLRLLLVKHETPPTIGASTIPRASTVIACLAACREVPSVLAAELATRTGTG